MINELMEKDADTFMYDNFALGDKCHQFGIWSGCRPDCPVFGRGQCELQEENTRTFLENGDL